MDGIEQGNVNLIENLVEYDNKDGNLYSENIYALYLPSGIEKYSVSWNGNYKFDDNGIIIINNEVLDLKLTSVSGNATFSKVKIIIQSRNNIPLPRTFIFN